MSAQLTARIASSRPRLWGRFLTLGGFDANVVATLLFRSWSVIAGAGTVAVMPLWLGQIEQGYYYTFASLLAIQIFFELGMNQVILQLVAHDFAHLKLDASGGLAGSAQRIGRLASLVRLLRRWYLCAATAFALAVGSAGTYFFLAKGTLPVLVWFGAWLAVCFGTAANLYLSASLTVLEGCGEIAKVARLRLFQSVAGYLIMWFGLLMGAGLWAVATIPLASACCTGFWLRREGRLLVRLRRLAEGETNHRIDWRTDIFPLQWRIALSWISGYFIFNLFTPLAFARHGAVEAGRLGIALAVFNALLSVSMSWVNAKVPIMAAHVSLHQRPQLNEVFRAVVKRSLVFAALGNVAVLAGIGLIHYFDRHLSDRIVGFPVLACLSVITLVNGFIFAAAAYMRAHKQEPMLGVSLVSGVATLLGSWAAIDHGVLAMMLAYGAVVVFVSLPWTVLVFKRYYSLV